MQPNQSMEEYALLRELAGSLKSDVDKVDFCWSVLVQNHVPSERACMLTRVCPKASRASASYQKENGCVD